MKHFRNSRFLAVLCLVALACFGFGCSDDDDDSTGPSTSAPTPPMADLAFFPVPTDATDDDGALVLLGAYSELMTFVQYQKLLAGQLPEADGESWVRTLHYQTLTLVLTATPNAQGWAWTAHMSGTNPLNGITYDGNWLAVSGQTTADVMSGSFDLYYSNTTEVSFHTDYAAVGAGAYELTQTAYHLDIPNYEGDNTWSFPADMTGTYEFLAGGVPVLHAEWNADGSGFMSYFQGTTEAARSCWDTAGADTPC